MNVLTNDRTTCAVLLVLDPTCHFFAYTKCVWSYFVTTELTDKHWGKVAHELHTNVAAPLPTTANGTVALANHQSSLFDNRC